jgi:hypothetical protein
MDNSCSQCILSPTGWPIGQIVVQRGGLGASSLIVTFDYAKISKKMPLYISSAQINDADYYTMNLENVHVLYRKQVP